MRDHRFKLGGERWLWRYSRLRGSANGWTDYEKKLVHIHDKLSDSKRLEIELHEGLHASLGPTVSEEAVTLTAKELKNILWALGYRIVPRGDH